MIRTFCIPGRYHDFDMALCQDAVYYNSGDGVMAAAICDGAGSYKRSGIWSRRLSEFVGTYLLENAGALFDGNLLVEKSNLADTIERYLFQFSREEGIPYVELASTIAGVLVRGKECVSIHLGDGAIYEAEHNRGLRMISPPENGRYLTQTMLTAHCQIEQHLRIKKFATETGGLLLVTDGADERLMELKKRGFLSLKRSLERRVPFDDASAVLIEA